MAQTISAVPLLLPIFYSGLFVVLMLFTIGSILRLLERFIAILRGM